MNQRARVLVVDDAVVVRRIVTEALRDLPDIEVVGTAANGKLALAKIASLHPDLVTLDVEMPEMDGLATLKEIRKVNRRLPVVMFSTLTARGAGVTIDALMLGANDYVTKPSGVANIEEAMQHVRDQLVPKIRALCGNGGSPDVATVPAPRRPVARATGPAAGTPAPARRPAPTTGAGAAAKAGSAPTLRPVVRVRIDAVVIAVSTGGPNALERLVPALSADLRVPVLMVQHMPPVFTSLLAERLDAKSGIKVREARDGETVGAGQLWIAPGDHHMEVVRTGAQVQTSLNQGPLENSCRPAADPLFRSAVSAFGGNLLAVVLTGMGHDGLAGCEQIAAAGGHIVVQDEASSVVWGMPGAVARAGLANKILPIDQLATEINQAVASPVGAR